MSLTIAATNWLDTLKDISRFCLENHFSRMVMTSFASCLSFNRTIFLKNNKGEKPQVGIRPLNDGKGHQVTWLEPEKIQPTMQQNYSYHYHFHSFSFNDFPHPSLSKAIIQCLPSTPLHLTSRIQIQIYSDSSSLSICTYLEPGTRRIHQGAELH